VPRHPGRVSVALRAQGLFATVGLVVASVTGAGGIARGSDPLLVQVSTGALHGVADVSMNEWRGIPYAAPPVGPLRWRPPAPPASWTGVRDASQFGTHCIQIDFQGGTLGSEDCLYLNVFGPVGMPADAHLPVMVHLHPGGNTFGWGYESGGSGFYDSVQESRLVDHGVIVVTINYRLGVFGVVGHPALTAEGSLPEQGMLDQIAAQVGAEQHRGVWR
jgi:para-nitrobenzyl esterase